MSLPKNCTDLDALRHCQGRQVPSELAGTIVAADDAQRSSDREEKLFRQ
jgi:hypothetical protein